MATKKIAAKKTPAQKAPAKKASPVKTAASKPAVQTKEPLAKMSAPNVGDLAPDFTTLTDTGSEFHLAAEQGKFVVVYFYPKADTPGCTKEACSFRDANADLQAMGVVVVGLSPDPVSALAKFKTKYHLNFTLLSDIDHKIAETYGAWVEKSMYGKKYMGVARSTYIVGKDGKIAHVFPKVTPEGHAEEVLQVIRGL